MRHAVPAVVLIVLCGTACQRKSVQLAIESAERVDDVRSYIIERQGTDIMAFSVQQALTRLRDANGDEAKQKEIVVQLARNIVSVCEYREFDIMARCIHEAVVMRKLRNTHGPAANLVEYFRDRYHEFRQAQADKAKPKTPTDQEILDEVERLEDENATANDKVSAVIDFPGGRFETSDVKGSLIESINGVPVRQ